jgi:hypothetical protein
LLLLILGAAVCISGCKGCSCRSTPNRARTPEELEKELEERAARLREQEKKKPLRELRYASLPHGPMGGFPKLEEKTQAACFVKPGHWSPLTFSAVANNFDIVGNLELAAGEETPLPGMPFSVSTQRSVALPQGQPKTFDTVFYLPEDRTVPMRGTLDARRRSGGYYALFPPITRMPYYQFHFLVLARYPESYTYLKALDAVANPSNEHYRLSLISPGRRTPLPTHSLFWTSTAYTLWDDADPDGLSLDQQVALLDWIHWGGQLIVSGPETMETLSSSFLADYLPATSEGTRELTAGDFDEINRHWTLPIRGLPGQPLAPISKWSGVKFKKHADSQYVPKTGDLVVERRIGRGRVLVSAFKLSGLEIVSWPGWDGFFNGCLLRRPARRFSGNVAGSDLNDYSVVWAGGAGGPSKYSTEWLSQLRYFSRDTGRRPTEAAVDSIALGDAEVTGQPMPFTSNLMNDGLQHVPVMNYAAWNDFNAVSDGARIALADAAGIEVPDRSFVVWIVAGYLVVLVPLNWLLFRMLGRVEWAWVAAPVIAVVCAVVVVRQAQLDIGFVRSENEVAVVEIQADYPRGHVTRYSAFYTSLGTGYDFEFDDLGAQILPFPSTGNPKATGLKIGESPQRVRYQYGSEVHLENLRVKSSSAQMTHSEQMLDLGGGVQWLEPSPGMFRVVNQTSYQLRDAGIVRKTDEGRILTAWLGTIDPDPKGGTDVTGRWQPAPAEGSADSLWPEHRDRIPQTGLGETADTLSLRPLLRLAEQTDRMQPGDTRLIAWTDEPLPGMKVRPAAPQKRRLALIVANLRYGFGEDPIPDQNSRYDFTRQKAVYREGDAPRGKSESSDDETDPPEDPENPII